LAARLPVRGSEACCQKQKAEFSTAIDSLTVAACDRNAGEIAITYPSHK